jgi:hypothetical protein
MRLEKLSTVLLAVLFFVSPLTWGQNISKAPEGARVYFVSPANGAVVESPVTVRFGLSNMGVAPAGVNVEGTGHHHLLIDVETLPDLTTSMPSSEQLRHFGKGQTEVQLELSPGVHSLQLLMGNYLHIPHDKPVLSEKITITVR